MSASHIIVVIGGGAAGFFAAVTAAKTNPNAKVILLEKTRVLLAKVRISGGGRCNVTHSCFDPKLLVKNYPRGEKALIGPFHQFQPRDTMEWFESRNVTLKTEEDGRIFPTSDSSETIINCLVQDAARTGVEICLQQRLMAIERNENGFLLSLHDETTLQCSKLIMASGSSKDGFELAQHLGHTITPPVPSLFTFNIPEFSLKELAGISVENAELRIDGSTLHQSGPLLITHWGFSGPAALKLSAWGARYLHDMNYEVRLCVNWLPEYSLEDLTAQFVDLKKKNPAHTIMRENPFSFAKQLWKHLLETAGIDPNMRLADIPHKALTQLAQQLKADPYDVRGKTTYKQEFVTCGGISLDEVNFKTMESRKCSGLYFAGEILDIDGVTGGFNFQNAWTTGWIAGKNAAE